MAQYHLEEYEDALKSCNEGLKLFGNTAVDLENEVYKKLSEISNSISDKINAPNTSSNSSRAQYKNNLTNYKHQNKVT